MIHDVYGNTVQDLNNAIIVSAKEAERLRERARSQELKCTCLTCNPIRKEIPMITTITVNQRSIKWNAENPDVRPKPVVCVNRYLHCTVERGPDGQVIDRFWGTQVGFTEHYMEFQPEWRIASNVSVIYDPVNKTPCGASCWMEVAV